MTDDNTTPAPTPEAALDELYAYRDRMPYDPAAVWPYNTTGDMERANRRAGHHWFSPDTLRFWNGRVSGEVFAGSLFVSSERQTMAYSAPEPRRYTVRICLPDGTVDTVGQFGQFDTLKAAQRFAREVADAWHPVTITGRVTVSGHPVDVTARVYGWRADRFVVVSWNVDMDPGPDAIRATGVVERAMTPAAVAAHVQQALRAVGAPVGWECVDTFPAAHRMTFRAIPAA